MSATAIRRAHLLCASSLIAGALALAAPGQALAQNLDESEFEGSEIAFTQSFADLTPTAGNDTVTVAEGTALYQPYQNFSAVPDAMTFDFAGGVNTINSDGFLLVGTEYGYVVEQTVNLQAYYFVRSNENYEAFMQIQNLTTFNNRGDIYLGAFYSVNAFDPFGSSYLVGTDRRNDDILSMPGADFVGQNGSRLFLDVNLNATGQTSCGQSLRATNGDLPVSDCIDLTGGSASGRTLVNIFDLVAGDRGAYNPQGSVIVDVSGGDPDETSPNAFAIDPGSIGYDARTGVIDKGLFAYTIGYDADAQQFRLYGVESAASRQLPLLAHAANDLWRTASGGWFDRQVGRRDGDGDGMGGGFWARLTTSKADRGVTAVGAAGSNTLTFDNSYEQEDSAVTLGVDLITGDGEDGFVVGTMIGYARSEVAFNDYDNTANLEGMHAGAYGGVTLGGFFLDAALNGTWLDLDNDVPALDLTPAGTKMGSKIASLGGRIEAGWRMGSESFGLEPLVGLTYVSTAFDDIDVPADDPARIGGGVSYEDAVSMRGSLGVRFSMEEVLPMTRLSLTARQVKEFEGEAKVSIANIGPTAATANDAFDGQFSELTAAVTVANDSETVAGYLNLGAMFGDDYDKLAVSAGVRIQW